MCSLFWEYDIYHRNMSGQQQVTQFDASLLTSNIFSAGGCVFKHTFPLKKKKERECLNKIGVGLPGNKGTACWLLQAPQSKKYNSHRPNARMRLINPRGQHRLRRGAPQPPRFSLHKGHKSQ